tara:strand:+ start:856 stop:1122 length:267 start_codon:yes stop_codon:yes gene_type:complete
MTQTQIIELVQQHHPEMGEAQIRLYLNRASDEFCRKTRILKSLYTFPTVSGKRYYNLDSNILEVTRVDYDNYEIPRLGSPPEKIDTDV